MVQPALGASLAGGGAEILKSSLCRFEGAAIMATTMLSATQPATASNKDRTILFMGQL